MNISTGYLTHREISLNSPDLNWHLFVSCYLTFTIYFNHDISIGFDNPRPLCLITWCLCTSPTAPCGFYNFCWGWNHAIPSMWWYFCKEQYPDYIKAVPSPNYYLADNDRPRPPTTFYLLHKMSLKFSEIDRSIMCNKTRGLKSLLLNDILPNSLLWASSKRLWK